MTNGELENAEWDSRRDAEPPRRKFFLFRFSYFLPSNTASPRRRERFLAIAAIVFIAVGFALRLIIALQPIERLIPACLADDAFYYLRIAENILAGRGPTFDGQVATNGYHPLWMVVSLAAVKFAGGAVPGARVLTVLLAAIGALNAALIWRLATRAAGAIGGVWAAGFWSLSPYTIFTELMGVEAPLMIAFVLAALLVYQPLRGADAPPKKWLPLGALLGLALLARTDAILFAFALALDVVVAGLGPVRRDGQRLRARLAAAMAAAGVAALVVAPWIAWNLARFGTVTQDSFRALIYSQRASAALDGASLATIFAGQLTKGYYDYLLRFVGLPSAPLATMLLLGLPLAAVAVRLATGVRFWTVDGGRGQWPADGAGNSGIRHSQFATRNCAPPAGAAPALVWAAMAWLFYLLYFWQQKMWYFLPTHVLLALGGALLLGYFDRTLGDCAAEPHRGETGGLEGRQPRGEPTPACGEPVNCQPSAVNRRRRVAAALGAALAVVMLGGFAKVGAELWRTGLHGWQKTYLEAAAALRQMAAAEPGLTAAGFNSGILSAFSGLPVINLDGVVNPDASRAAREKKLLGYLRRRGVDVVVDHLEIIAFYEAFAEPEWRNAFVGAQRFATPPSAGDVAILRVRPSAPPM